MYGLLSTISPARASTTTRCCSPRLSPCGPKRSVSASLSFSECGRLGVPILTARLPVALIKERWAAYEAGLDAGGHDAATKAHLLAQSALWRNVYVADSNTQAEDELSALLLHTRAHMMHV